MRGKRLVVSFVIMLAVVWAYLSEQGRLYWREAEDKASKRLFSFPLEQVALLALDSPDHAWSLRKTDGQWRFTRPYEALADNGEIAMLLDALLESSIEETIADDADDLKPFGLDAPSCSVRLEDGNGKKIGALKIGAPTPANGLRYAGLPDSRRVFALSGSIHDLLNRDVGELRDKTVFGIGKDEIQRVSVVFPDGVRVEIGRSADGPGAYWTTTGLSGTVDADRINALLSKIESLKAKEYVPDASADLEKHGLVRSATELTLTVGNVSKTLMIGSSDNGGAFCFAVMKGVPGEFLVEKSFVQLLPADSLGWRLRYLTPLRPYQATFVRVDSKRSGVITELVKRDGRSWVFASPREFVDRSIDSDKIAELLKAVCSYDVLEYVTDVVISPAFVLTVSNEYERCQVVLGDDDAGKGVVHAARDSEKEIFTVKSEILERLSSLPEDLCGPTDYPQTNTNERR